MPFKDHSKIDFLDLILFYLRRQASRVVNIKYDEFYYGIARLYKANLFLRGVRRVN